MHIHSRHIAKVVGMACALFVPEVAHASDVQTWAVLAGKIDLDPKTEATLDIVARSNADSFDIGQANARIAVRRDWGDQRKIQATHQYVDTVVSGAPDRYEHRLGQTLSRPIGSIGAVAFDARVVMEERFQPSGGELGWRARERLRASTPIAHNIALQISEEAIASLNDTDWGQRAGLTATRLSAGVRFGLSNHWGVSPGYNWQHIFLRGAQDRNDHIAALTVDFRY